LMTNTYAKILATPAKPKQFTSAESTWLANNVSADAQLTNCYLEGVANALKALGGPTRTLNSLKGKISRMRGLY